MENADVIIAYVLFSASKASSQTSVLTSIVWEGIVSANSGGTTGQRLPGEAENIVIHEADGFHVRMLTGLLGVMVIL